MMQKLLLPEVQKFIKDHQRDDPFLLSLHTKMHLGFPLAEAIEQIQSRQKAHHKLPTWNEHDKIIFPNPISVEQSSSEITAWYKTSLIHGKSIVDLTGGMGVDASYFADKFEVVNYVEPEQKLCELAKHNFNVLNKHIAIHQSTAEQFLETNLLHYDVLFIDPSRRAEEKKVFRIRDCSPNLYDIMPQCLEAAGQVLLKLSPLVDVGLLIRDFHPTDIWVVAVKGEVKEVLCLINGTEGRSNIHAVDIFNQKEKVTFSFSRKEESDSQNSYALPKKYLYEPNSAMLKAGAFKLIGKRYKLKKLHQHTHLYTSNELIYDFPGKIMRVVEILSLGKKETRKAIPGKKINVITRNFPLSPSQLKKKFDLKDGGENFLIGATLMNEKKVLLLCDRI